MGGQNGAVAQNNNIEADQNQQLIQGQDNSDVSILVDPPSMKEVYAIRNPIYLKKETLSLERDAQNNTIYYIKFNYDSLVDFDLYINFNVKKNQAGKKNLIPNSNENQHILSYLPSQKFENKGIVFKNLPKGENLPFFENQAYIDMEYFNTNKIENPELNNNLENNENNNNKINRNEYYYDISIEMVPLFDENTQEYKDKNEIIFVTLCRISKEDNESHHYIIKSELQRLRTHLMWIDMYDIFNCALDSGECLICCSELRNTVFLPCNHSCTCNNCAHSLRMRNSSCPICKKPIDDLLILETEEEKTINDADNINNINDNNINDNPPNEIRNESENGLHDDENEIMK